MTERHQRLSPDPPRSPGTPEPPDLDVPEADIERLARERREPAHENVTGNEGAGEAEPPD